MSKNPNGTGQGFRVCKGPMDDRTEYETVDEIFEPSEIWIHPERRYDGLSVWIKSEQRKYRFVGGTDRAHFVPDPDIRAILGDPSDLIAKLTAEGYLPIKS